MSDEIPTLDDIPKSGDVFGTAYPGHKVDTLEALVVVQANGDEGLASIWNFAEDGTTPVGRLTLVASAGPMLEQMRLLAAGMAPPHGGRFEWRKFRLES